MDSFFGFDKVSAHDETVEHLTTVHNNVELSIVRSILEGENIPYMVRERGSGGVVRVIAGYSMYGSDVFVPAEKIDAAREILDAYQNGEIVEDEEAPAEE